MLEPFRHASRLTRSHAIFASLMLAAAQVLLLGFIALWQHGAFGAVPPRSSDFVSFYAAGRLALAGMPALAYDQTAHYLTEQAVTAAGVPYQFFYYPPVFLPLCAALAALPYYLAFALFELATLQGFLIAMQAVLGDRKTSWIAPVLAFPAVFWTIGLGQNAFLTAALFAGFTVLLERRPITAGLLLSAVCYKPHFGLLAPIALAAGGHWRTFAAAMAGVAALVLASVFLFGWDTWHAYFSSLSGAGAVYGSGRIDYAGIVTPFGAARLLGIASGPASALQAGMAALMALTVALVWRSAASLPLRAASLLAATLLAVPLALLYDNMLLLVAIGWVAREARTHGFLAWEKTALAALYPLCFLIWPIGTQWHVPLGPVASACVLGLCIRRVWHALPSRQRTAPLAAVASPASPHSA